MHNEPTLELMLHISSQFWNHLITKGSNIKFNPLKQAYKNSQEYWKKKQKKTN